MVNHYDVLQVSRTASASVIKAAHRAMMKEAHPDTGGDPAQAARLNEARDVLLDADRRAAHDRELDSQARDTESRTPPSKPPEQAEEVEEEWGTETAWETRSDPPPTGGPVPPPYPGDPGSPFDASSQPPPYPSQTPNPGYSNPGYSNPGYGPGPGGVERPQGPRFRARQVWASANIKERTVTWVWLGLSLVGPIFVVFNRLRGQEIGFVQNLIFYAVVLSLSLHVGWTRITEPKMPKRYLGWVALSIWFVVSVGSSYPLSGLFFGAWTVSFVLTVELRRRRLWQQN